MEEDVFTISITVSQPAAKIDGTVEIVDDYGLSIVASQQGVELEGVAMSEISQTALIAFGQWYKGDPGQDGQDGGDGFSPVVTVTPTENGHEVTITDASGDHTFDVNDGVGVPQTLSLDGNELTLSDGGGTVTLPDGLPSQTGNAGKFLTTDGTSARWGEIPKEDFLCTFTVTNIGGNETQISCDKSIAEIIAAARSGKNVKGFAVDGSGGDTDFLVTMSEFEDHYVAFQSIIVVFGAHLVYFTGDDSTNTDVWSGGVFSYSSVAFSGDYQDLRNKPTLGTASTLDVAESGNASTTQVVKGDDTRLSDSRNAADVYPWAKANTKPSYTASEVGAIASSEKGANNGVAELDATGKVPSSQLPSYVDDVLEYASLSAFPATGDSGKIYIALDTNKTYRWGGSSYTEISASLALGETSSTAYAGNKGKANADAISAIKDGTSIDSFGDVETALADKINKSSTSGLVKNDGTIDTNTYLTQHQDISGKADKVSSATSGNLASLDSNGNLTDSGAKDSDYVHITGAETITGVKKFTQPVTIQNGAGPGSLIFGADVNAGTLTHNTRKLGRINSPTEDVRNGSTATLLGWDTQGNLADDMHTANRNYDTVSFGGMKKISTNTSPMNIVFCVTKIRNSRVPADKVYPIEMDANEVRFNVRPNYVGNRLLNTTDILDSTSSTATDKAATPNAVKSAYDLAAAAIPKSLGTAAGDIIYYTANGTPARLAKGTTGQVLTINSGATAPEWTDVPTELPALTNNASKILAVNSGATGVEWINNSGGGGGLTNYDFTHTANTTVSTSTATVTFAANTRGSQMITVSDDISISFVVNNDSDNYLWIENSDTTNNIDVTISSVTHNGNVVSNVRMPRDGIAVPAGGTCEIGIVCNTDGAFITSRDDLE